MNFEPLLDLMDFQDLHYGRGRPVQVDMRAGALAALSKPKDNRFAERSGLGLVDDSVDQVDGCESVIV